MQERPSSTCPRAGAVPRLRCAVTLALSLVLGVAVIAAAHAAAPAGCPLEPGATHSVARVIDGETLLLDDGARLRLIGALAPRASDVGARPGTWPSEQRVIAALGSLAVGRSVMLWLDKARVDRYGQTLAHVVVQDGSAGQWLQAVLVEQGLARAYALHDLDRCVAPLISLERTARAARRGLWAEAAYQPRQATADTRLESYAGSFQLVTGTVVAISGGRGATYLSLEPRSLDRTRLGFAAMLVAHRATLPDGMKPHALKGRRVMVRGWLENRRGPLITIDAAGQLEILDR